MIELNVKEARACISKLLDRVEAGEEVVLVRRGRRVARIVPEYDMNRILPPLAEFRAKIRVTGKPLSKLVSEWRDER
jgi:prevent-host-death family protein